MWRAVIATVLLPSVGCGICTIPCGLPGRCDLDDYETTRAEWLAEAETSCADEWAEYVAAGECENGINFLTRSNGFSGKTAYFDADTGVLRGHEEWSDVAMPPCWGVLYWRWPIGCPGRTVTDVFCEGWNADLEDLEVASTP